MLGNYVLHSIIKMQKDIFFVLALKSSNLIVYLFTIGGEHII